MNSELQSKVEAAAALLKKGLIDHDGSIVFANSLGAERCCHRRSNQQIQP